MSIPVGRKSIYSYGLSLLLFGLGLALLPLTALAQDNGLPRPDPVILTLGQEHYPLGRHLELLADPTGQLTIEDVASPAYAAQFSPSQADIPNFGFTSDVIWVRFQVRDEAGPTAWRLAVADGRLGYVDLYLPTPAGTGFRHQQAGRSRLFTVREVPYHYGVFKLPLPPGQAQTVYLRFQSTTVMVLPLTIWSLEAFSQHAQTELLGLGLLYGVLLVMLGYNLFLFVSLCDRNYLYLALFIASFGLNDAFREGIAQQYLWPEWRNLYGTWTTVTLSFITAILFGVSFLQIKTRTPRLYWVMVGLIPLAAAYYVLLLLGWNYTSGHNLLAQLISLLLVAAGYLTWRQGYQPARYFLLAWLLFLTAIIFSSLVIVFNSLGVATLLPSTPFDQSSTRFGAVMMVLLLSLALADRINELKAAAIGSERRLNQFLEAMPVGVTVYDTSARLAYINHHARHLLNLPDSPSGPGRRVPTLEQNIARTWPVVADSQQPYPYEQMPVRRALRGEAVTVDDMEVGGPGERRQLEVWASPIFDGQERLQYAIAAFQDITRRKQLETELRQHHDHLEELVTGRTRELAAFLDMTMLVGEGQPLPTILAGAMDRILEASQCQAICLHLLDEDKSCMDLLVQRGLSAVQQERLQCLPLEATLVGWLAGSHEPILNLALPTGRLPADLHLEDLPTYLGAQLRAREQVQGLLSYYRPPGRPFSLDEVSLLAALAEQLGIVIENHRLRGHVEEIAVVGERQRLARDLHDSINQSLFSLNLFAHAGREAVEDGDAARLEANLAQVETLALSALKEMRLLLHQLQPLALSETGLAEALQLRFDAVERRLGIAVDYRVEGQADLPDHVTEALYPAALETLNNILQHAAASQVTVCLALAAGAVRLEIADNGRGFDPTQVKNGLGLKNIRQRLEQVGGGLEILSAPGSGTRAVLAVNPGVGQKS